MMIYKELIQIIILKIMIIDFLKFAYFKYIKTIKLLLYKLIKKNIYILELFFKFKIIKNKFQLFLNLN